MRRLTLGVLPLLLLAACDRSPVGPEAATRSTVPVMAASSGQGATIEEVVEVRRFPATGLPYFTHWCTGQPARLFGGVTVFYRYVTRPDGTMLENWWTTELHDDWRLEMDGQMWRAVRYAPRHGTVRYDADGNVVGDHGRAVIFTLESETTGARFDWNQYWHFVVNGQGEMVLDILRNQCRMDP